jgi:dethiobiotin synthetase/adenosylmethionine--8-amino-7-oxononanoate aminotransferase
LFGETAGTIQSDEHGWTGLPVIFDEVFTGLYRLGRFSAASLIDTYPDISVHAKLLTGGVVPLCATLASKSIFSTFEGEEKSDALLHGHSYTAHAMGCQVAVESLREMLSMESRGAWDWAGANGWTTDRSISHHAPEATSNQPEAARTPMASEPVWSMWSRDFVDNISQQTDRVSGVWALGSVLAISMRATDGAGYESNAAAGLQEFLREGTGSWNAHTRAWQCVLRHVQFDDDP